MSQLLEVGIALSLYVETLTFASCSATIPRKEKKQNKQKKAAILKPAVPGRGGDTRLPSVTTPRPSLQTGLIWERREIRGASPWLFLGAERLPYLVMD